MEAYGKTLKEAFENAALGFWEIMTDTSKIKPKIKKIIKVKSENKESLLYDFLEQFLILHDSENLVFSKFKIIKFSENELECETWGEEFDPKRHIDKTSIKAITYHEMKIGKKNGKYFVHFIVDI
ncbi:MAG: archease [Candidatus Aenigmarchaeota archaeon]|nr:archease [Candidatus Aenigmarchaeota archaeon]